MARCTSSRTASFATRLGEQSGRRRSGACLDRVIRGPDAFAGAASNGTGRRLDNAQKYFRIHSHRGAQFPQRMAVAGKAHQPRFGRRNYLRRPDSRNGNRRRSRRAVDAQRARLRQAGAASARRGRLEHRIPLLSRTKMTIPAVQRDTSARSDVALYALLELSKALSSEFNLDKLLAVIVEKASAVVEAERTRILLYDDDEPAPPDVDRNLTNTGSVLRAPVIDSHGNVLGLIESVNKTTQASFDAHDESLMHALATHVAVAIERARMPQLHLAHQRYEQSLRLASEIQMRMLPSGTVQLPDH